MMSPVRLALGCGTPSDFCAAFALSSPAGYDKTPSMTHSMHPQPLTARHLLRRLVVAGDERDDAAQSAQQSYPHRERNWLRKRAGDTVGKAARTRHGGAPTGWALLPHMEGVSAPEQ